MTRTDILKTGGPFFPWVGYNPGWWVGKKRVYSSLSIHWLGVNLMFVKALSRTWGSSDGGKIRMAFSVGGTTVLVVSYI